MNLSPLTGETYGAVFDRLEAAGRDPYEIHPGWLRLAGPADTIALIGWAPDTTDPIPFAAPTIDIGWTFAGCVYRSADAYADGTDEGEPFPPVTWTGGTLTEVVATLLDTIDATATGLYGTVDQAPLDVFLPVLVTLVGGQSDSMAIDHESAPWMDCGSQPDVWDFAADNWCTNPEAVDDATREVHRAWAALAGLREIHARFSLGGDDDDVSGADICDALFSLMGRIGLEVA